MALQKSGLNMNKNKLEIMGYVRNNGEISKF